MKVGFIQFAPLLGDIDENIRILDRMIAHAEDAELLVLPELCSTGYRFKYRQRAVRLSESVADSRFVRYLETVCETVTSSCGRVQRKGWR